LASIPGLENFAACPIGALNLSANAPSTGTASYARSCAPLPEPSGDHTIQRSAVPDAVPSDVTAGGPDENPNASALDATRASAGVPLPPTPYLYARRYPDVPLALWPPEAVATYT
jgi:hypothetical protein